MIVDYACLYDDGSCVVVQMRPFLAGSPSTLHPLLLLLSKSDVFALLLDRKWLVNHIAFAAFLVLFLVDHHSHPWAALLIYETLEYSSQIECCLHFVIDAQIVYHGEQYKVID